MTDVPKVLFTAKVHTTGGRDGGASLSSDGRLNVSLPGLEPRVARELIESGHRTCPYSKVTRRNIDVLINLVNADSAPLVIVDTMAAPEKRL